MAGNNNTVRGQQRDKPFRDALRIETKLAEQGEPTPALPGSLRYIARALLDRACTDTTAAVAVADRLDGKPAQEATITADASDAFVRLWTLISDGHGPALADRIDAQQGLSGDVRH